MSDLYTTSAEARRETVGIGKTGNFWQDWYTDRVRDGVNYNEDTGEYDKTGLAFYGDLLGTNNQDAITQIEEGKDKVRDSKKIESTLDKFPGITEQQLSKASGGKKLTGSTVKGVAAEAVRKRGEQLTPLQEEQVASGKRSEDRAISAQEETTNARKDTNSLLVAQMAQSDKNRLADRADAREARADDRMMQLEMYERADRKEEKNRRRESIQALVSGLSSLGAAFAV